MLFRYKNIKSLKMTLFEMNALLLDEPSNNIGIGM